MIQKEWVLAPQAPNAQLRRYTNVSPILAQILLNRGFDDPERADRFLNETDLGEDPFALPNCDKAVARIETAIAKGEPIVVYGDFDADGVSATVLFVEVLTALGAKVTPYIPHRIEEGYGLNTPALEKLAAEGNRLVVTVDCGIRSVHEVAAGQRAGLDIIVTDHHSIGPELPPALAVVNPQLEPDSAYASLAGVGVAFMLAKALLLNRWRRDRESYPRQLRLSDVLDLVALGTVADLVALNDNLNRRLVRHGLNTINELRRPGIAALAKQARLQPGRIVAADIGFVLGPRINAAGRLGSATAAYNLLAAGRLEEAVPLAQELQIMNTRRQKLTRQAQGAIVEQVAETDSPNLIFAGDESFLPGIVGLVAGRLAEEFYRPAIVFEIGSEQSRASCRSIPEFNITQALDECADLLVRHGGHAMAAGFTVDNCNIDSLRLALERKVDQALADQVLRRRVNLDLEIDVRDLTPALTEDLERLEPTGHANPPATFLSRQLQPLTCRRVGDEGRHLKLRIARNGQAPLDAIGFGMGEWATQMPMTIDAVYHLEMNEWNGNRNLQMRLLDIRESI